MIAMLNTIAQIDVRERGMVMQNLQNRGQVLPFIRQCCLQHFTLANARRFHSLVGDLLASKVLTDYLN